MRTTYDAIPAPGPIEHVVFDLGGVVFTWTEALPELRQRIGAPDGLPDDVFGKAYGTPRSEYDRTSDAATYWRAVAAACGAPTPSSTDVAELTAIDIAGWSNSDPATLAVIDEVHRAGVELAILSNAPSTMGDHVRSRPWAGQFGPIIMSGEVHLMKPDAEIYRYLLHELDAPAERVAFIDDLPQNIAGARDLGINGIRFTGPDALRRSLAGLGVLPA